MVSVFMSSDGGEGGGDDARDVTRSSISFIVWEFISSMAAIGSVKPLMFV